MIWKPPNFPSVSSLLLDIWQSPGVQKVGGGGPEMGSNFFNFSMMKMMMVTTMKMMMTKKTLCDNEKDGGWCGLVCHATVVASVPHLGTAKNKHSPDINKIQIHPAQKAAMIQIQTTNTNLQYKYMYV